MNKVQVFASTIISFLLSFFIFIFCFLSVSRITLMNEEYLVGILDSTQYYAGVRNAFIDSLKKGAGAAGFDPEIYDNFVTTDEIKEDARYYITTYFKEGTAQISTDEIEERLTTYLYSVVEEEGIELTEDDEERLQSYIQVNVDGYRQYVQFPFIQYIVQGISMMQRIFPYIFAISFILMVIAGVLVWKVKLPRGKSLWFIGVALAGAGCMLVALPMMLLLYDIVGRINLRPEYFYVFFTTYLEQYLWLLILVGLACIVSGWLFFVYRKKKYHRRRRRSSKRSSRKTPKLANELISESKEVLNDDK